jgi:hypothetical protein
MSELYIRDDLLMIVETGHGEECAAILTANLKEFEPTMQDMQLVDPEMLDDKMYKKNATEADGPSKIFDDQARIAGQNQNSFDGKLETAYRIWRALAPGDIENSGITGIAWDAENALHGICGKEMQYGFKLKDGKVEYIRKLKELDGEYIGWLQKACEQKPCEQGAFKLPAYPGRQFKAISAVSTELTNGRTLIGTQDGLLAIYDGKSIYSLGMAGYNGPVRALTSTPDKKTAYGVAGDDLDLGMVFRYDDKNGLVLKGNIEHSSSKGSLATLANSVLSCCSISGDGKMLAVASIDRLGTVYIYRL